MIYQIGICDDEILTSSELKEVVIHYFKESDKDVEVYIWNSIEIFIRDISLKKTIDILFLNMKLFKQHGIDIGNYIKNEYIINILPEMNTQLYKIYCNDFLMKPIDKSDVYAAITKFFQLGKLDKKFFLYEFHKKSYSVLLDNIVYFESERKHIKIICSNENEKKYVGKLNDIIEKLPFYFFMIGQSYIINLNYIKEFNVNKVIMDNGHILNVSRSRQNEFVEKMKKYSIFKE